MSASTKPYLMEGAVTLVMNHVKSNIVQALTDVRTLRNDKRPNYENPKSFFIYPSNKTYQAPAIFVIGDEGMDFQQGTTQANHVNAMAKVNVSAVIESRTGEEATYGCWRYQTALHSLLSGATLQSQANDLVLTLVVTRASFSPLYSNAKNQSAPDAIFRKEVILELDVMHRENF